MDKDTDKDTYKDTDKDTYKDTDEDIPDLDVSWFATIASATVSSPSMWALSVEARSVSVCHSCSWFEAEVFALRVKNGVSSGAML